MSSQSFSFQSLSLVGNASPFSGKSSGLSYNQKSHSQSPDGQAVSGAQRYSGKDLYPLRN